MRVTLCNCIVHCWRKRDWQREGSSQLCCWFTRPSGQTESSQEQLARMCFTCSDYLQLSPVVLCGASILTVCAFPKISMQAFSAVLTDFLLGDISRRCKSLFSPLCCFPLSLSCSSHRASPFSSEQQIDQSECNHIHISTLYLWLSSWFVALLL